MANPRYWVCAYANNQWTLDSELVEDLAETSFARAMRISMGTVSVVDRSAGCFGRIWCVYELSYSVSREGAEARCRGKVRRLREGGALADAAPLQPDGGTAAAG